MEPGPAETPPPTLADAARGAPYRPIRRRANWAIRLLVLGIVVDLVAIASDGLERGLLARIEAGELITDSEATANDLRQAVVGAVQGAVFTLTAVFFIAWFHRAYRNLEALGAYGLRFGAGWAIGGWFMPIMNLWRPKQIANDIWRASDPESPADQGALWQGRGVPLLYGVWWAGYLIMSSLYSGALRRFVQADEIGEFQLANSLYLAADITSVVTGILAILVVQRTTRRQERRAAALGLVPQDLPTPLWRRKSAWAVLAGTLAVFTLQGAVVATAWTVSLGEEAPVASPPADGAPASSDPDVLLEDDFAHPGAWLIEDSDETTFGYAGGAYRIVIKERESLWSTASALPQHEDSIAVDVDMSLQLGRVRTDYYGVGCIAASQGSYLFGISPDGYYTIAADPGGDDEIEINRLLEDWADRPFRQGETPNSLHVECIQNGRRALLRLAVNGTELVEIPHRPSLGDFIGVQFFVFSARGDTEVRFDDLLVERLDER